VSDHGVPAEPRLASINRQQLVLRSIDVERLVDEDHSARLIWLLIGRLDLSLYHAQIEAVEGRAGREHTDPQWLISLWIYAYSRGISSARELARQCEYQRVRLDALSHTRAQLGTIHPHHHCRRPTIHLGCPISR